MEGFEYLKPGDKVTRMLAGTIPMKVTVEKIEDGLIHMEGGWTFNPENGFEVDGEIEQIAINLGLPANTLISFLVSDPMPEGE